MDPQLSRPGSALEDGWHIIPADWWRIPFWLVSWPPSQENRTSVEHSLSKAVGYFESSLRPSVARFAPSDASSAEYEVDSGSLEEDLRLNPDLVGVRGTMDVVALYENDVGFNCSNSLDLQHEERRPTTDLCIESDDAGPALSKERWNSAVENLVGGLIVDQCRPFDAYEGSKNGEFSLFSSVEGLHRSTPTLSSGESIDLVPPIKSVPMPPTLKAISAEAKIDVKHDFTSNSGPCSLVSSPSRPLNASASSFVPSLIKPKSTVPLPFPLLAHLSISSPPPSPSPAPINFIFPSLDCLPLPSVRIEKDQYGFYSEVKVTPHLSQPQQPSLPILPPLPKDSSQRRRAHASKTRAMVDHLRSTHQSRGGVESEFQDRKSKSAGHSPGPTPSPHDMEFFKTRLSVSEYGRNRDSDLSSPSSVDDDDDGWIDLVAEQASQESRAKRTRDLFRALTRRRSGSISPKQILEPEESGDDTGDIEILTTFSPSPSSPPLSNIGWIGQPSSLVPTVQVTTNLRRGSRSRPGRKRRASNVPAPPTATLSPSSTTAKPNFSSDPSLFSPTTYHFPAPAPHLYGACPPMAIPIPYASYMRMQMQMQLQLPMRAGRTRMATAPVAGKWFPYSNPALAGLIPSTRGFSEPFTTPNMSSVPASGMGYSSTW